MTKILTDSNNTNEDFPIWIMLIVIIVWLLFLALGGNDLITWIIRSLQSMDHSYCDIMS